MSKDSVGYILYNVYMQKCVIVGQDFVIALSVIS